MKVKIQILVKSSDSGVNLKRADRADITTASKFSYFKELVIPKIRALIDGLSFNTDLKAKFGKPRKVTNAHIQCIIMSLLAITQTSFGKIHYIFVKLVTYSQAFDTTGKLKEINGYVTLKLDKLPTINVDLVRADNDKNGTLAIHRGIEKMDR